MATDSYTTSGDVTERKLTPKDMQILQICASMPRRLPTDFQAKHAIELLAKLRDQGFEGT